MVVALSETNSAGEGLVKSPANRSDRRSIEAPTRKEPLVRIPSWFAFALIPGLIAMVSACESENGAVQADRRTDTLSDLDATPETDASAPAVDDTAGETANTAEANDSADRGDSVESDTATPDTAPDTQTPAPDTEPDTQTPGSDTAACPPVGPTGTAIGDVLADTTLTTCEGSAVSLYSFCGRPLYINTFAGWCPPCRTDASNAAATAMTLPDGAQWLFVITENNSGTAPSTAYCQAIRDTYGLTMPVLIDTSGTFPAHIGVGSPNSWHLVLDAGFGIVHRVKYDQRGALDALNALAP